MDNLKSKKKLAVVFGGRSGEHGVSLDSAQFLLSVLNIEKYDVFPIGINHSGTWFFGNEILKLIRSDQFTGLDEVTIIPDPNKNGLYKISNGTMKLISNLDVVFPILHGTFGEDGALQGLLELADLAYVGGGILGSSVGMDKGVFKDVMRATGIPVVDSLLFNRLDFENNLDEVIQKVINEIGFPVFVKPANMGSSVGISKCTNPSDLMEGLVEAAKFDRRILVEKGINGREIEISVLGNEQPRASIPGEILPSREFYSYESKYVDGTSSLRIPAPLPEETSEELREVAIQAYKAIDCAGMARVDFFLDKDSGKYYINELNTLPGFTSISMYPKLWQESGMAYEELVDNLIDLALERKSERDLSEHNYRSEA